MAELTKKQRKSLLAHMEAHLSDSALQYATWAKYALKIEITPSECAEIFMDGLGNQDIEVVSGYSA